MKKARIIATLVALICTSASASAGDVTSVGGSNGQSYIKAVKMSDSALNAIRAGCDAKQSAAYQAAYDAAKPSAWLQVLPLPASATKPQQEAAESAAKAAGAAAESACYSAAGFMPEDEFNRVQQAQPAKRYTPMCDTVQPVSGFKFTGCTGYVDGRNVISGAAVTVQCEKDETRDACFNRWFNGLFEVHAMK